MGSGEGEDAGGSGGDDGEPHRHLTHAEDLGGRDRAAERDRLHHASSTTAAAPTTTRWSTTVAATAASAAATWKTSVAPSGVSWRRRRICVRTKGIEASARAASTAHTATARRAGSPPAITMAAAAAVMPMAPHSSGTRRRPRLRTSNHSSTANSGAATANGTSQVQPAAAMARPTAPTSSDQLDQRDPPCQPCPRQRAPPSAIDQRQLQRRAHEEGEERRRADRHAGPGEPDEQPQQHRFQRQPPSAVLAGDGNGSPQRAIACHRWRSSGERTAVTR